MSELEDKTQLEQTIAQQDAFEYYYECGDTRTLKEVADKFNKSEVTIKRWSSQLGWSGRITQRERQIAESAKIQIERSINENKGAYRSVTRVIFNRFVTKIQEAVAGNTELPLEIKSLQDLERIIKMDVLMLSTAEDLSALGLDETKVMKEARVKSIMVLSQLLYSGNENVRLRAADLLSRQLLENTLSDEENVIPEYDKLNEDDLIKNIVEGLNGNPELIREFAKELNEGSINTDGTATVHTETETTAQPD